MQWPPTPRAWLQDVDARVLVGQLDELPDVDAQLVADQRQLVRESDVDVAERVLGELGHLGGAGVGEMQVGLAEGRVERPGALGGRRGEAADDAVIGDELLHHASGQHPLGRVGVLDAGQLGAGGGDAGSHMLGGAGRRGRLENDELVAREPRDDRVGGGIDVAGVDAVALGEGRGYRDDEHVRLRRLRLGAQASGLHRLGHEIAERRFDERHLAAVDGLDMARVHIDARHVESTRSQDRGGGQPDIAEADDDDRLVSRHECPSVGEGGGERCRETRHQPPPIGYPPISCPPAERDPATCAFC